MKQSGRRGFAVVLGLVIAMLVPGVASADESYFGARFGYYASSEHAFVGAEFLTPVTHRIYFNPNVEYVFVDSETYMTFNADFHYDFPTHHRAFVWLGGGLGVAYVNPEGPAASNTDVAANFLAGIGARGHIIPYFQFKLIAKGDTEAVFAFGLRF